MLDVQLRSPRGSFELDVAFQAPDAATTVLVGESGAGKTSILRLAAGLDRPDAGKIVLDDMVYADTEAGIAVPAWQRDIGFVAQDYALFPHLTVRQNVGFGLEATGTPRGEIATRVAEALRRTAFRSSARVGRTRSPADSSNAPRWPARWCSIPGCCCWMNRWPRSISRPGG